LFYCLTDNCINVYSPLTLFAGKTVPCGSG
jgi:hypothetical protein